MLIILGGLILALIAYQINSKQIAEQVQTERIIVAKVNIDPFTALSKELLVYREVVLSEVPEDAVKSADEIKFTDAFSSKYGFVQGMPIRQSLITTAADSGLGTAVSLHDGMLQFGVQTDLTRSSGNEVKPGIMVDVYAFLTEGSTGQGRSIISPELRGLKVVKCLNSEGKTPESTEGGSLVPSVVVLEVTSEQAALLMEYQETGKVYLLPSGTALSE